MTFQNLLVFWIRLFVISIKSLTQVVVTLWYRAPEVLHEGSYHSGIDLWVSIVAFMIVMKLDTKTSFCVLVKGHLELWLYTGRNSPRSSLNWSTFIWCLIYWRNGAASIESNLWYSRFTQWGGLATGKPNFEAIIFTRKKPGKFLKKDKKQNRPQALSSLVPNASDECLQLLEGLLHLNLSDRLNASDALRCSWFTNANLHRTVEGLVEKF